MKDLFFNIARNALILAAAGAVIAVAFPYVAMGVFSAFGLSALTLAGAQAMLWPAGVHTGVAAATWLASYFGVFGALTPAFTPIANKVFGVPDTSAPDNMVRPLAQEKGHYPDFSTIDHAQQAALFADQVKAQRAQAENSVHQH